jgi:hypothetical protein
VSSGLPRSPVSHVHDESAHWRTARFAQKGGGCQGTSATGRNTEGLRPKYRPSSLLEEPAERLRAASHRRDLEMAAREHPQLREHVAHGRGDRRGLPRASATVRAAGTEDGDDAGQSAGTFSRIESHVERWFEINLGMAVPMRCAGCLPSNGA